MVSGTINICIVGVCQTRCNGLNPLFMQGQAFDLRILIAPYVFFKISLFTFSPHTILLNPCLPYPFSMR